MQNLVLYAVTSNTDLTEGRGREYDVGYFHNEEDAQNVVRDKRYAKFCCMGTQSPKDTEYKVSKKVFPIYQNPSDFWDNHSKSEKIIKIFNKLTTEEQELLGIKLSDFT